MDAVEFSAWASVIGAIVILIYLFYKGYKLINEEPKKK